MVTQRLERYRDELQAHYTRSTEIVTYMVAKLKASAEHFIWEPCAGGGDLIEGVLQLVPFAQIHASEINPEAAAVLEKRFSTKERIKIAVEDALEFSAHNLFGSRNIHRIIANPPYGAWQDEERRVQHKKRFPSLYVKDTYAVFLYHCLQQLETGGRLVFIMPETFLWLHRHEFLRRHLLLNTQIEEIALFPSKFFPGVNFGYAGLCILTLVKDEPAKGSTIRVFRSLESPSALLNLAAGQTKGCEFLKIDQLSLLQNDAASLRLAPDEHTDSLGVQQLGDLASVVTGFYSGNDRQWVRKADQNTRNGKHIEIVDQGLVYRRAAAPSLDGIRDIHHFIPIMRGGAAAFYKPTTYYLDWSTAAVAEYRRKGPNPARFQNSRFYFRQGIGVPMVKSSRMSAALIDNRVFDQGIVGIFPNDETLTLFLLGFLNTNLATRLTMEINPTANNSANYLKRLPIVLPTPEELDRANMLVSKILTFLHAGDDVPSELLMEHEDHYLSIWKRTSISINRGEE